MSEWFKKIFNLNENEEETPKEIHHSRLHERSWFKKFNKHIHRNQQDEQTPNENSNLSDNNNKSSISKSIFGQADSQQPTPQRKNTSQNDSHDSDEDSLGYTEDQWDEQTINLQLQDRMLDCLQDQKHVDSYRQSLSMNQVINSKSLTTRLSKFVKKPSNPQDQPNEISIEKIIEDQFCLQGQIKNNDQTQTQPQQKTQPKQQSLPRKQKPRKNRFQKFMKKNQTIGSKDGQFVSFSPQLQGKIDKVLKVKDIEISIKQNESCQDFIDRVMDMKILPKNGQQNVSTQKKLQKQSQTEEVNAHKNEIEISQFPNADLTQTDPQKKPSQNQSQSSLTVVQEQQKAFYNSQLIQSGQSSNQEVISFKQVPAVKKQIGQQIQQDKSTRKDLKDVLNLPLSQSSQNNIQNKSPRQESVEKKNYHVLTPPNLKQLFPPNQYSPCQSPQKKLSYPLQEENSKPHSIDRMKQKPNVPKISFKISPLTIAQNSKQKMSSPFQPAKSPRNKVVFNYGPKSDQIPFTSIKNQPQQILIQITSSPQTKAHPNISFRIESKPIVSLHRFLEPYTQDRIPIFLRKIRRLNSCYPNIYLPNLNVQKINYDLKTTLTALGSALCVIELLFKKLIIQKNRLQEPFEKIHQSKSLPLQEKQKVDSEIMDFFMNSQWENFRIEEIDYIRPKQNFKKRLLNPLELERAIKTYHEFIKHYLSEPYMPLKSPQQLKRYLRIREKISNVIKYLKIISEDLYSFWLMDCSYPELYYDYLNFLKMDNAQLNNNVIVDQTYSKLLLASEYNDPISLSIVGKKIKQKINQLHQ